jgi:hypothetical protein
MNNFPDPADVEADYTDELIEGEREQDDGDDFGDDDE